MDASANPHRLRSFLSELSELVDRTPAGQDPSQQARQLLADLVAEDDWLPSEYAIPDPDRYQQYLLYADPRQRFSVVSFVWGPGQSTPIHDHRVWGLIGMLRGAEYSQGYVRDANGSLQPDGAPIRLDPGHVESLSPSTNDIHQVHNAYTDQVSISIHVYGANIGAVSRAVYTPDGTEKQFISGYSNTSLPNLWDLSKELRAS
ncbi:MAG: cysteine dioxygenase type [Pseudomonas sp.]|nr:cysteine dioxygenase type [Pseudomonas sp.]